MKTIPILAILVIIAFSGCKKNDSIENVTDPELSIEGITWSQFIVDINNEFIVDSVIVEYGEILGYDSTNHIFLLAENAGDRIRENQYPASGRSFSIALDGEVIYTLKFMPGYSSMILTDIVCVEPYSLDNSYEVKLGYPSDEYFTESDPRNNERIISKLIADDKLMSVK